MDDVPVTLVVKVPNQQFDDYAVQCEPTWSIKRLKEHLAEVHPCKPGTDEQKLIYSGQLLTDKVIIKDILRHYDGASPPIHTFHLVYTPKIKKLAMNANNSYNKQSSSNDTSRTSDGLRHRNVVQSSNTSNVEATSRTQQINETNQNNIPQQQTVTNSIGNCPTSSVPNVMGNFGGLGFPNQPPNEYLVAQQVAMQNWMQQAYMQYMNQYMNLVSLGVRPETVYMQNAPTTSPLQPTVGVSQLPQIPVTNLNLPTATSASPLPTDSASPTPQSPTPQIPQPAPEPENPQPQQRFANIVQEEIPENRDWLDVFYTISRLMMLLTLVCFYSSPLRCLAVAVIGLTIYFYHVGLFRPPSLNTNDNNNNANNSNNNRGEQDDNRQEAEQPNTSGANDQPSTSTAASREGGSSSESSTSNTDRTPTVAAEAVSANDTPEVANNPTSVITFIKTFVVSFFVSLLPDAQTL